MKAPVYLLLSFLLIGTISLHGQCAFSHSPFDHYTGNLSQPVWVGEGMYTGEYVRLELAADLCYRIVVVDTAVRPLHLRLLDERGENQLALTATPGGEAMILMYRSPEAQTVLLTLSEPGCERSWQPVQVVIEQVAGACKQPQDRLWQAPLLIGQWLLSGL